VVNRSSPENATILFEDDPLATGDMLMDEGEPSVTIDLPYNWTPREYQARPFWAMVDGEFKRADLVWHRRAGKDLTTWNILIVKAFQRVGLYLYGFPTYAQARKVIWDGMTGAGRRFVDYIPQELIEATNSTEMKITLVNGSILQLVGVDNIDRLVGTNPVGIALSEFPLQDPTALELLRPILAENGGWLLINGTPRGRNHGYTIWRTAKANPKTWLASLLTVDDTRREDGSPVVTQEAIDEERANGMSEEMVQQEFYCSFDASLHGAYYSKQVAAAYAEGRVCKVPVDCALPVHTAWDLGVGDATAIWFYQTFNREIRIVRYYENTGEGLPYYLGVLNEWRQRLGFAYGDHYGPHDLKVREMTSGRTRLEIARSQGLPFVVLKKAGIDEGIDAARRIFSRCWFDEELCAPGLAALAEYTKDWDEKRKVFSDRPRHDWTSHGADGFRYLAMSIREPSRFEGRGTIQAKIDYGEDW